MKRAPKVIAAYINSFDGLHKKTLLDMRRLILEVIPEADEIIKYGMPTFVVDGTEIAGLMAHKNHVGYYPYSGSVLSNFPALQSKYVTTKGGLHVPLGKPMTKAEVKKLVKLRLAMRK